MKFLVECNDCSSLLFILFKRTVGYYSSVKMFLSKVKIVTLLILVAVSLFSTTEQTNIELESDELERIGAAFVEILQIALMQTRNQPPPPIRTQCLSTVKEISKYGLQMIGIAVTFLSVNIATIKYESSER